MRILCDEHVAPAVVNALQSEGFDARRVSAAVGSGMDDAAILTYASENGYLILTNDSDFLEQDATGVLYYDDQSVSRRDIVRSIRVIDDVLGNVDLTSRTLYLPDGWV